MKDDDKVVVWFDEKQEIWLARCPKYQELFGTDTVPTAYTKFADSELVRAELKLLNPEENIEVITPKREIN